MKVEISLVCEMQDTKSAKVIGEARLQWVGGGTGLNRKPGRFSKSLIQTWQNTVGKPAESKRIESRDCYVEPDKMSWDNKKMKIKNILSPATSDLVPAASREGASTGADQNLDSWTLSHPNFIFLEEDCWALMNSYMTLKHAITTGSKAIRVCL